MQDICNGMIYLSHTSISSHGRLKSSNCVIDNRWTLKITGKHVFWSWQNLIEILSPAWILHVYLTVDVLCKIVWWVCMHMCIHVHVVHVKPNYIHCIAHPVSGLILLYYLINLYLWVCLFCQVMCHLNVHVCLLRLWDADVQITSRWST